MEYNLYAYLHIPTKFTKATGMYPFVDLVDAHPVIYSIAWERLGGVSWRLGQWLRRVGNQYAGSAWNAAVPIWDEMRLLRAIDASERNVAHFIFGEFASPSMPSRFRKKHTALVGTFHASRRRQPTVTFHEKNFMHYDQITLMSASQKQHFIDAGYPEENLSVILHGVDTQLFSPRPDLPRAEKGPLRGLLMGATERDHAFMAQILKKLPDGVLKLAVRTTTEQEVNYANVPHVELLPRMNDHDMLKAYQDADLLVMPLHDCTANNAILEAMACGTPVMTNCVGGIPEYVSRESSYVMDGKDVDDWVATLTQLSGQKADLHARRPAVRAWAERFGWEKLIPAYRRVYGRACASL